MKSQPIVAPGLPMEFDALPGLVLAAVTITHPRQVDMAHKRLTRQIIGLFDVPGQPDEDHEDGVFGGPAHDGSVFGGPAHDGSVFGAPGRSSGLFDAPDRTPGEMPGLFEKPRRIAGDGPGRAEKPARAAGGGLFDKPAAGGGLFDKPKLRRK
jgi:hypothetical protein